MPNEDADKEADDECYSEKILLVVIMSIYVFTQ